MRTHDKLWSQITLASVLLTSVVAYQSRFQGRFITFVQV